MYTETNEAIINGAKRAIAQLLANGLEMPEIMEVLESASYQKWSAEVEQTRTFTRICMRCHHNIEANSVEICGTGVMCKHCSEDKVKERDNGLLSCARCKVAYPRKNMQPYYKLKMTDAITSFFGDMYACDECAEVMLEEYKVHCLVCDKRFTHLETHRLKLCEQCKAIPSISQESTRVQSHNARAQQYKVPATLTLGQWIKTLRYFQHKCAYCLAPFNGLEHYTPITLGGGTTHKNCLPSCTRCNMRKRDKHPTNFTRLFPTENIARIQVYFDSLPV